MKMNIKGLVFVGFAAAVFAGAARADSDKVVTSKTYVDGKIVQTLTDGDTTHAPSADKVRDELALKQNIHISDNASDHGKTLIVGDTGDITISDVSAVDDTNTTYTISSSQTTDGSITVTPSEGNAYDVAVPGLAAAAYKAVDTAITDQNASSTNLPTTKAVYDYVDALDTTAYTGSDGITLTDHNFTNSGVRAVTSGSTFGTVNVNTNGTATDVAVNGLGSAAGLGTATTISSTSTNADAATAKAVYDYVDALDTTAYTGSDGITLTDHNFTNSGVRAVTSGSTFGTVNVNTNGTAADVAVNGLGSAAGLGTATTISSTSTDADAATAKAVYDFVTTPANVLPTNANCTTSNPCALVMAGTSITWEPIQQ